MLFCFGEIYSAAGSDAWGCKMEIGTAGSGLEQKPKLPTQDPGGIQGYCSNQILLKSGFSWSPTAAHGVLLPSFCGDKRIPGSVREAVLVALT